jgi:hypothetical protein
MHASFISFSRWSIWIALIDTVFQLMRKTKNVKYKMGTTQVSSFKKEETQFFIEINGDVSHFH